MSRSSTDWQDRAACVETDGDAFFPLEGFGSRKAISICSRCPVTRECLNYALVNNFSGIWGGTSEKERQKLRRNM
jgi:WhiB family transcriptional regulator, redox-sensing transcriptional regulator